MNSTLAGRTIVVPLDGSTAAEQAIPLAVGLARATQSRVRLLHVRWLPVWPDEFPNPVPLPTTRRMLDSQGVTYMSDVCERLQATGLEIETVVLPGELLEVGQVILEYLEAHPVDLVVMATHGRGSVKRAWLGGVTDYLVRHLTIPVLAVRPGMALSAAGRQILVPLDGSGFGEAALDEACALAGATQQPLVLLGVVDPVMQPLAGLEATYVGLDPESTELRRSAAEEYLKQLEARVQAR
ncbi:MAG TPA: universal stress protein, partial [Gemmatimonadales bacterium]|nr:universal stress protein [Gemmatimonadales bacterium]